MRIDLSSGYLIVYEDGGYTLKQNREVEKVDKKTNKKTGETVMQDITEGYYGTIHQAVVGAYKHKIHGAAIDTLEQLEKLQKEFEYNIIQTIRVEIEHKKDKGTL